VFALDRLVFCQKQKKTKGDYIPIVRLCVHPNSIYFVREVTKLSATISCESLAHHVCTKDAISFLDSLFHDQKALAVIAAWASSVKLDKKDEPCGILPLHEIPEAYTELGDGLFTKHYNRFSII
jgi:hypothetical protein